MTSSEQQQPQRQHQQASRPNQLRLNEDELAEFTCLAHAGSPEPQIDWLASWRPNGDTDRWTEWVPIVASEAKKNGVSPTFYSFPLPETASSPKSALDFRLPEAEISTGTGSGEGNSEENAPAAEESEKQTSTWSLLRFRVSNWPADRLRLKCRAEPKQFAFADAFGRPVDSSGIEPIVSASSQGANLLPQPVGTVSGGQNKLHDNMIEDQRQWWSWRRQRQGADVNSVIAANGEAAAEVANGNGSKGNGNGNEDNELQQQQHQSLANGHLSGWFEIIPNRKYIYSLFPLSPTAT